LTEAGPALIYPNSSLADLYDRLTMPKELVDAHHALDRAVDRLYQRKPFESDAGVWITSQVIHSRRA
jgi:hypothetical protein